MLFFEYLTKITIRVIKIVRSFINRIMSFHSATQLVKKCVSTVNMNGRIFAHTHSCQASFFVNFYDKFDDL